MLTYKQRERIKATYRPIMDDDCLPLHNRIEAAEYILRCLYWRSCEAMAGPKTSEDRIEYEADLRGHPSQIFFIRMLLNQGSKSLNIPQDVYRALVKKYGKQEGIHSGTYYIKQ